jgi:hypothetical protein
VLWIPDLKNKLEKHDEICMLEESLRGLDLQEREVSLNGKIKKIEKDYAYNPPLLIVKFFGGKRIKKEYYKLYKKFITDCERNIYGYLNGEKTIGIINSDYDVALEFEIDDGKITSAIAHDFFDRVNIDEKEVQLKRAEEFCIKGDKKQYHLFEYFFNREGNGEYYHYFLLSISDDKAFFPYGFQYVGSLPIKEAKTYEYLSDIVDELKDSERHLFPCISNVLVLALYKSLVNDAKDWLNNGIDIQEGENILQRFKALPEKDFLRLIWLLKNNFTINRRTSKQIEKDKEEIMNEARKYNWYVMIVEKLKKLKNNLPLAEIN